MSNKCPHCYREIGTWSKDPILLLEGSPYKFISDTVLSFVSNINQRDYKGLYQLGLEILQIQEILKELEEDNLDSDDWTSFSSLNDGGIFQITSIHIQEMRSSIEKLLTFFGFNKEDFFNYDEEGNHITHPDGDKLDWTDPIIDEHFQLKYIHIEELRHFISNPQIERWNRTDIGAIVSGNSFTGDIGINAWNPTLLNETINYSTPKMKIIQTFPSGQWFVSYDGAFNDNTIAIGEANIAEVSNNKLLNCLLSAQGYSELQNFFPPPNGWYPYGTYSYSSYVASRVPAINVVFLGTFNNKRPIINANKIFICDLVANGVKSAISIIFDGVPIIQQKLPYVLVTARIANKQIGELGIHLFQNLSVQYSIEGGYNDRITIDIWDLLTQSNPTYKYLSSMTIRFFIDLVGISAQGSGLSYPITVDLLQNGSINVSSLDNIGLIARS